MATKYETENPFALVEVPLTGKMGTQWTQVKAGIHWQAAGFYHLMVTMLNQRNDDHVLYWTKDVKTLATDGFRIAANPDYYFSLTLPQRIFAVCHEVVHGMWNHNEALYNATLSGKVFARGKAYPFVREIAAHAVDYVVNDLLVSSKIGQIHPNWLHDRNIATYETPWVEAYARLYEKQPPQPQPQSGGGGGSDDDDEDEQGDDQQDDSQQGSANDNGDAEDDTRQGKSAGEGHQDDHMVPGALGTMHTPEQGKSARAEMDAAWSIAIDTAKRLAEAALARGNGTADQIKFFQQFLMPKLSWTDEIQGNFAKKVGSGSYDYRRPDRRLITRDIYAPSRSGHGCRTLVIASDTSGSIFGVPHLIERFFAETAELMSTYKPLNTYVLWVDAEVKRAVRLDDVYDLQQEWEHGAEGGGGTSFKPPFKWVEENEITDVDALVYLTDLEGDFPDEAPSYPVMWVSINHKEKAPFGDTIYIPADGTA